MSDNDKEIAMQENSDEQPPQQAPNDTNNWDDKDATAGNDPQKYIRTTDSDDIVQ